jgi:hypothetical protein
MIVENKKVLNVVLLIPPDKPISTNIFNIAVAINILEQTIENYIILPFSIN